MGSHGQRGTGAGTGAGERTISLIMQRDPNSSASEFEPATSVPIHGCSRREVFLGGALLLLIVGALAQTSLWRPEVRRTIRENVQIAEAQAWWQGRLDLPERKHDTALKDGRVYSYFPPMFTFLSAAIVPWFDGVPHAVIVALGAMVPLLAYALFLRLSGSVPWAMVLSLGLIAGTSVWPVLDRAVRGGRAGMSSPRSTSNEQRS